MSALVALLLVFVLPAVAAAVLLASPARTDAADPSVDLPAVPPAVSPDLLIARGVACGLATWMVGSGLLARTVGLTPTSAWVWTALVAAASLVVLLLPRHRARLRAVLGALGRRLAVVVGLAALVYVPLGVAVLRTTWSPLGSTPWYYYGLARQVADLGSVPATSMEFGTTAPFLNDYHLFTTGTAMLLVQDPGHAMAVITMVTLVGVALLGLGAAALTSALGAGRTTALLAVPVAIASGLGPIRLAGYRPEGFALGLTLLLVALGVDWLRSGDRRSLVAGALLAATLSQVHGIAAVTAGVLLAAAALVFVVRGPRRAQLQRVGLGLVALVAAVVIAGLLFRGASGTATAGGIVDRGGLADPTWEFYQAARDQPSSIPPSNASLMSDVPGYLWGGSDWWIVAVLVLAGYGLWRRRRDPVARGVVFFTVVSLVVLLAIASVFMLGWQGYVPRRTGASRFLLETSLLAPPLLAIGLDCAARETWSWRGRPLLQGLRKRRLIMLAVLSVCGVASVLHTSLYVDGQAPTRAELTTWQSLPLTSKDVVLANGYTEGFIPDVTGAQGLLDGRAPYTFGSLLYRANGLFRGAQAFFADPAEHWDFLGQNDVTWVVVGRPDTFSLSTSNVWQTPRSLNALENCAGLERVVAEGSLTVFRVRPGAQGC
ncbi:MAG: hypothetical protein J2P22_02185 [Nocardioides sp.]|nr:hypothetical protein [Nocardioides sp.]